jgi:hypothetical protein
MEYKEEMLVMHNILFQKANKMAKKKVHKRENNNGHFSLLLVCPVDILLWNDWVISQE